jgi:hypothetical protein
LTKRAGVELLNGQAYGIRVYKNGSTLVNHVDRSETHVISCIFHGEGVQSVFHIYIERERALKEGGQFISHDNLNIK